MKLPKLDIFGDVKVFLLFAVVRFSSVFIVQTFFVPDEYYQSLEVAHKLAFGYGYLTWEWTQGIRSYFYPLVFAVPYKILYYLGLDSQDAIIYVPRVLQSLLSAYADVCIYKWSGMKKWAFFIIATSWFWFYMASRTIINTFETSLTAVALSKFPWIGKSTNQSLTFLWIIASLFMIRPTSAIIGLPLCLFHIITSTKSTIRIIITEYVPIGAIVLTIFIALDSIVHGSFIVTPYNFLKFNVFNDVASIYGVHPWHWYLSNGLPSVLGILIVPFIMATLIILKARKNHPNELWILGCIVFSLFILSCLPHKEFRFILPLLPMILYITSKFLAAWSRKANMWHIWLISAVIFIWNVIPAWYIGYNHQRGTLDVMNILGQFAQTDSNNTSFLFLMPCHSTPLYSHIHVNVTARFLTCNPNLNNISSYVDEADAFYHNPNAWLRNNYPPNSNLPSHIICYDNLLPIIGSDVLTRYKKIKEFFHTNFPVSSRMGRYVLLYERNNYAQL
ncbi:phosphatidylinositol glycan anchor biosynthesis class B [Rhynchophorus ferrugineus]|uniref:phosphatidylinositol glycan anchor biosynthesis class B n=1 Tax=Rhynchophorus ferrugineus TaxID=354439 RepID=UPI003FCE2082